MKKLSYTPILTYTVFFDIKMNRIGARKAAKHNTRLLNNCSMRDSRQPHHTTEQEKCKHQIINQQIQSKALLLCFLIKICNIFNTYAIFRYKYTILEYNYD